MIEERNGWRIKTRGNAAGLPIAAEYMCPVHGRVAHDVYRDANGDAPAMFQCLTDIDGVVACGIYACFVISAPAARVKLVEVVRGGYQKPERETWTDTENLGEGQDIEDWHDERDKVWERDRENSIKEILNDR